MVVRPSYYPKAMARKRIKSASVNNTFKPIETKEVKTAIWSESVVCVPVTHQTVEGAEKSRRYIRPTKVQIEREKERKEKIKRRKEFERKWEERKVEEMFRNCNIGQTFIH